MRSADREDFLRGILTTLAEQGLQFGVGEAMAGERDDDGLFWTSVTIRYPNANDAGMIGHLFTTDDLMQAILLVRDTVMVEDQDGAMERLGITREWRNKIALALRNNDAGTIDPTDAADLAEIAFYGRIYY